ncbi:MAG: 50S ribosomal protein L29 [Rikenellaceae bacterium]
MKISEIKELSAADLQERIAAAKDELSKLKVQHAISPIENPSLIKKSRREIALMMTVLGDKTTKC